MFGDLAKFVRNAPFSPGCTLLLALPSFRPPSSLYYRALKHIDHLKMHNFYHFDIVNSDDCFLRQASNRWKTLYSRERYRCSSLKQFDGRPPCPMYTQLQPRKNVTNCNIFTKRSQVLPVANDIQGFPSTSTLVHYQAALFDIDDISQLCQIRAFSLSKKETKPGLFAPSNKGVQVLIHTGFYGVHDHYKPIRI